MGGGAGLFWRVGHGSYRPARDAGTAPDAVTASPTQTSRPYTRRGDVVASRVADVIANFAQCVSTFDSQTPFDRALQVRTHAGTIRLRSELGSPAAAIASAEFIRRLRATIKQWGIGSRGSRLVPEPAFRTALEQHADDIEALAHTTIDDPALPVDATVDALWRLIAALPIVDNKAKIVACTKTLHHLLPDLVVPMDGRWTRAFFEWPQVYLINRQQKTFAEAYRRFVEIARATAPASYVGDGWRTSRTKVLDNAVIGYCKLRGIEPK